MFDQILTWLKYTDKEPPHYVERFFHIRKLVESRNSKMSNNFIPGWISCFYESMMISTNKFVPVWVVLPRNPHPFWNECHTIFCAMSVVVFFVELVEGRDLPIERGKPELEADYGATGGLMIRMTKPLFGTGKYVVMDSYFCALKG